MKNNTYEFRPRDEVLAYIEEYYENHGYHRVEFFISDPVPLDNELTEDEYFRHYAKPKNAQERGWFDNYDNIKWIYCLYGNWPGEDHPNSLGWSVGRYIFIARGKCDWYAGAIHVSLLNVERTVLMHEVGHTVGIGDRSNNREIYCSNPQCVMAYATVHNCINTPFYCAHHWRQRRFS